MDESLPPKPKELHITLSMRQSGATSEVSGVMQFSSDVEKPAFTGRKRLFIARMQNAASIEPEALVVCPVRAFVDDTGGWFCPKSRLMAALSEASLSGVPVPWAEM